MRMPGPTDSGPSGEAGSQPGGSPCDQAEHRWLKALEGGAGEVLRAGPNDDLANLLSGLNPNKAYALLLSEGSYGALAFPAQLRLSVLGACGESIASAIWTGGSQATIQVSGMQFQAGLALQDPDHVELENSQFKNTEGPAVSQQGGSLRFVNNTITASAGHGLALMRATAVIIGDNNFLGPLGGDGVFSDEQDGDLTIQGNRFEQAQGNGVSVLSTKPSVTAVVIGDNNFLGPLGGDGVFSRNQTPLHIQGNRFARLGGNGLSLVEQRAGVIIGDNNFLGPLGGDGVFAWQSGSETPSSIARNAIDNSARFGLFLGEPQGHFTLEGNLVSASGERGILVQDGAATADVIVRQNTIEGARGSALEVIAHLGEITLSDNAIEKVLNEALGGVDPPASGIGITALDSTRVTIRNNSIKSAQLAGVVVDLGQINTNNQPQATRIDVGSNRFDGQAKYDLVLQNLGTRETEVTAGDRGTGSAEGFGERFRMARKRATNHRCGNGETEAGEACDDGNRIDHDNCTNTCQLATCGDGIRRRDLSPSQPGYEACDLGPDNRLCQGCNLVLSQRLATADAHACVLRDGWTHCWGENLQGQVTGQVTRTPITTPHRLGIDQVTKVALGSEHSCLLAGEYTHCFGRQREHQLFNSNEYSGPHHNTRWVDHNLEDLIAGGRGSCIKRDSEGPGSAGWLCMGQLSTMHLFRTIQPVGEDEDASEVLLGGSHYCIHSPIGAYCAGDNSRGAISDDPSSPSQLTPIGVEPGLKLALGNHVTCYITAEAQVRCRGDYQHGRLGRGGSGRCSQNCARSWDEVSNLRDVIDVSIGDFHACALDRYGRVTCWGKNQYLALGNGTQELRSAPTAQVPLPVPASQIAVGRHYSCAELIDERVFCWGKNNAAQLGRGQIGEAHYPGAIHLP